MIGIVSSYGNNLLDVCAKNSLKLLELLGQTDVPVYKGLPHSSTSDHFDVMQVSKDIHGDNGIGDVDLPEPKRALEEMSGVDFYIEAAHQYGQDLIIIPTGPMTNLTDVAEANINQDAKAADVVLRSDLPLTMVGLDVTLRTLLTKKETQQWRELGTKSGIAFADITDFYIDAYYNLDIDKNGCALHDPLAVGVSLDPTFVTTISLFMKVIYDEHNYGRTIGDKDRLNDPNPNTKVAVDVDKERYLATFMDLLTNLFKEH